MKMKCMPTTGQFVGFINCFTGRVSEGVRSAYTALAHRHKLHRHCLLADAALEARLVSRSLTKIDLVKSLRDNREQC